MSAGIHISIMTKEEIIAAKIRELKSFSGSHSPSIETVLQLIPEIEMKIDACFLSNPYATELFLNNLQEQIISKGHLRKMLEYYPPQNRDIGKFIQTFTNISAENIFVGNGAIEIIQAILHQFAERNVAVPIPTFSSYYEFLRQDCVLHTYLLSKDNDMALDLYKYTQFISDRKVDTAIIINPSNPTAEYITQQNIIDFLDNNKHLKNIILDISFVHFAYENEQYDYINYEQLIYQYPNLILVKSMSKDFGIAGVRAGYAIMSADRVTTLLDNGYLWNSSGMAAYFFKLLSQKSFQVDYEVIRKKYIAEARMFYESLKANKSVQVLPSKSNFALVELPSHINSFDFTIEMLTKYHIYVRDCSDKIGLKGNYVRIASRSEAENEKIVSALSLITNSF